MTAVVTSGGYRQNPDLPATPAGQIDTVFVGGWCQSGLATDADTSPVLKEQHCGGYFGGIHTKPRLACHSRWAVLSGDILFSRPNCQSRRPPIAMFHAILHRRVIVPIRASNMR